MPCVYTNPAGLCDGKAPLSKNEHYLPRSLGNFKNNEPLVDRICDNCQLVCSKLEEVFARNSTDAYFRHMLGQRGRKKNKKKNIFYDATLGIPPFAVLGKYPGHDFEMLWEPVEGKDGFAPMSQLIFIPKEGEPVRLPFRPGKWTVDKIKEILDKEGIEAVSVVAFPNNAEEDNEMRALIDVLIPNGKDRDVVQLVDGASIDGELKARASEAYLRAIAKIGFHFLLKYFPHFTGLEPEFDEVKRYIYEGKADRKIVRPVDEPFLRDLQQKGARLAKWAHLLSAESRDSGIEARMQFFAGPQVNPIVWCVLISPKPSKYVQMTGHVFVYFDEVKDGYDGVRGDLIAV